MIDYKILKSGSSGNCVIIEDVMVDVGISFKEIKNYLYDINIILITHTHSDHLKLSTIKNIRKFFPKIKIVGNYEVASVIEVDVLVNSVEIDGVLKSYDIEDYIFTPFLCPHDVLCYGYVWQAKGCEIIYATDTSTLENAPLKKYDYFFIESNHDNKKLENAIKSKKYKYDIYAGAKRHLSTQDSKQFYYLNRKNRESEWIELHKSNRFY